MTDSGAIDHLKMRVSEADRTAVAERLQLAVDDGTLSLSEYDQRLQTAYAALTYGELAQVTADLPALTAEQLPSTQAERAAADRREWFDEWKAWLGGAVIMLAIWGTTSLVNGELTAFWPAIPLGIWAAILVASAFGGPNKADAKRE